MDDSPLFAAPCPVRFQDIDAAGIAFFGRVFDYFHDAYVAFLASRGVLLHEVLSRRAWSAPLVHAEADYRRPLRFGGDYRVEIASATLGKTSLTVRYTIRGADGQVHAEGSTVHVFIDLDTEKPRQPPEDVRAALGERAPT